MKNKKLTFAGLVFLFGLSQFLCANGKTDMTDMDLQAKNDACKLTDVASENTESMGIGYGFAQDRELFETDPEFMNNFYNFAYDEVLSDGNVSLEPKTRSVVVLAALLGIQATEEFSVMLNFALNSGVSPVEVKEIIYQATAYLGFGKVRPFLTVANTVFKEQGISLPLEFQGTTTRGNRREKGNQIQIDVFGEGMRERWNTGSPWRQTVNSWLASNCFGDYYTRTGLDIKTRELITFCFLAAAGGCESQLESHTAGNIAVGNDKEFLTRVVLNMTPYIGYPRSLNALAVVEAAK